MWVGFKAAHLAAAHLKVVQPLLDLLHSRVLEEVLAIVGALVDGDGWQVGILQPKVFWHLRTQSATVSCFYTSLRTVHPFTGQCQG